MLQIFVVSSTLSDETAKLGALGKDYVMLRLGIHLLLYDHIASNT
jgi:hypothetical protein